MLRRPLVSSCKYINSNVNLLSIQKNQITRTNGIATSYRLFFLKKKEGRIKRLPLRFLSPEEYPPDVPKPVPLPPLKERIKAKILWPWVQLKLFGINLKNFFYLIVTYKYLKTTKETIYSIFEYLWYPPKYPSPDPTPLPIDCEEVITAGKLKDYAIKANDPVFLFYFLKSIEKLEVASTVDPSNYIVGLIFCAAAFFLYVTLNAIWNTRQLQTFDYFYLLEEIEKTDFYCQVQAKPDTAGIDVRVLIVRGELALAKSGLYWEYLRVIDRLPLELANSSRFADQERSRMKEYDENAFIDRVTLREFVEKIRKSTLNIEKGSLTIFNQETYLELPITEKITPSTRFDFFGKHLYFVTIPAFSMAYLTAALSRRIFKRVWAVHAGNPRWLFQSFFQPYQASLFITKRYLLPSIGATAFLYFNVFYAFHLFDTFKNSNEGFWVKLSNLNPLRYLLSTAFFMSIAVAASYWFLIGFACLGTRVGINVAQARLYARFPVALNSIKTYTSMGNLAAVPTSEKDLPPAKWMDDFIKKMD